MHKTTSINELRQIVKLWRNQGKKIAFVPTMGNLHSGHVKLVTVARKKADKVIVSIFVNPAQFGVGEDFESYPRTEVDDEEKLVDVAADLLFLPSENEIYPINSNTVISVVGLSILHCGASRPGHFDGVALIVTKLFNIVQPDMAIFGEKDFQQLLVIKKMVQDLNIPVDIIGVPTEREKDGLAMSSRNNYLTKKERSIAPELYQSLSEAYNSLLSSRTDLRMIEQQQQKYLNDLGFKVEYFSICKANDLEFASAIDKDLVILAAAKLGNTRLIDNIFFTVNNPDF